jgi:hypothetical protein
MLCQDETARPTTARLQAASAIQIIIRDHAARAGMPAARASRKLAIACIPSGNTMLQDIGV